MARGIQAWWRCCRYRICGAVNRGSVRVDACLLTVGHGEMVQGTGGRASVREPGWWLANYVLYIRWLFDYDAIVDS
jgi:hypothetical protein